MGFFSRNKGKPTNSLWHRWRVEVNGQKDGKIGEPAVAPSDYERQLLARCSSHHQQVVEYFTPHLRHLKAKREGLIALMREHTDELVRQQRKYEELKQLLGRDVTIQLGRGWWAFWICVMGLGEFGLNAQAFDVLGISKLMTLMAALVLGVAFTVVAHNVGIWLRQWPLPHWVTGVKMLVALTLTCAGIAAINEARLSDLRARSGETIGMDVPFLFLNGFLFMGTVLISYGSHEAHQGLHDLHLRCIDLRSRIRRADARACELLGRIEATEAMQEVTRSQVDAIMLELVHIYRQSNLRHHTGKPTFTYPAEPVLPQFIPASDVHPMTPETEVETVRQKLRTAIGESADGVTVP